MAELQEKSQEKTVDVFERLLAANDEQALDEFLETAKRDLPAAQEDVESSIDEAKKAILEGTTWSKVKKWFLAIKGSVCESVALVEAFGKIMQFAQSVLPL